METENEPGKAAARRELTLLEKIKRKRSLSITFNHRRMRGKADEKNLGGSGRDEKGADRGSKSKCFLSP